MNEIAAETSTLMICQRYFKDIIFRAAQGGGGTGSTEVSIKRYKPINCNQ